MIVYGDRVERVRTADRLAEIAVDLEKADALPPGIEHHAALVGAFVTLGQIVQGVADADFARSGVDGGSPGEAALMAALCDVASSVLNSWESITVPHRHSREGGNPLTKRAADLAVLAGMDPRLRGDDEEEGARGFLPAEIDLKLPEGYAFYALYPESYAEAARGLVLAGPPRVIGIRSIGTGLAPIVAAVLEAPPPLTVRPTGHPFARRIALAPDQSIDRDAHYVVVDEGPGLSGSSFAAVAEHLEARGVPAERIAFLPSHGGEPGAQASERTRARWATAQRPVVSFDELIGSDRLAAWAEPLIGRIEASPEDVSGGSWRACVYAAEDEWPAVDAGQERRKFLLRAGGKRWLLKFAGLGAEGTRKLARARTLRAAGLVPEALGLVHGFMIQRWVEAVPLSAADPAPIEEAARYLGARARRLPPPGGGASTQELAAMARHNIGLSLGEEAAAAFTDRHGDGAALQARVRRVATDNRLDSHEWLRTPEGTLLKADALDHDAAHDLIGAQDLAWDVAGFAAELRLDDLEEWAQVVEDAADRPLDRQLLAFLTPCYLAFRLGAAQMAADSLRGWPAERARNLAAVERYRRRLATIL